MWENYKSGSVRGIEVSSHGWILWHSANRKGGANREYKANLKEEIILCLLDKKRSMESIPRSLKNHELWTVNGYHLSYIWTLDRTIEDCGLRIAECRLRIAECGLLTVVTVEDVDKNLECGGLTPLLESIQEIWKTMNHELWTVNGYLLFNEFWTLASHGSEEPFWFFVI